MVDLRKMPYYLSEEDIQWVEQTIASMSKEEKVGQLFFQITQNQDEAYLKELVQKYHIGGARYNPMPGALVLRQNRILQENAKIPLFIACNPESGGNGACVDGTKIGSNIQIGATRNMSYAEGLGRNAAKEAAAIGCNMAFAPVSDIYYNWENTEVVKRSFGRDVDTVADMCEAFLRGAHETKKFACATKHFPGNGMDLRDAHMSNNINSMGEAEWMQTYGKVYKKMIDNGLEAVMGGHIMMPTYMKELHPDIQPKDMLPGTLCPEIMKGLLREKLGFNGMVVTDASHMVGMTNRMKRCDMLPACINAGCDMFLFFNDPDEDFGFMLEAYTNGIISEERMNEALTRILGLKCAMGLTKGAKEDICPTGESLDTILKQADDLALADRIAADAITLVKYNQKDMLPVTPEKYPRIMITYVKGNPGLFEKMAELTPGQAKRKNPAEKLRDKLVEKGFDCFIYENPFNKMIEEIKNGAKPDMGKLYFVGKSAIAEFKANQDLVITVFDVGVGRPVFGNGRSGGEIPWYVFELPVVGVSLNTPTMLPDAPQLQTYINAYASDENVLDALVEKLMQGADAFVGKDPIDSFCGLIDTRM